MAKIVGDIAVSVGADVSGLQRGMSRATQSVDKFDRSAADMAKRFAKVGVAVAAAAAAIGVSIARAAGSAAQAATDINNLSRIAGVSAEQFQKLSIAAETVGISQEKVADIFKDVNDKFGDFMATGAGPLRDFFENIAPAVGVTADQFARLSGPEALQLYVDSLERAGVSQQQMTFYMEALASDATALIPLLQNSGAEIKRIGDEAQRSGQILGNDMVQSGAELDRKLDDLSRTIRQQFNAAILENADEIKELARVFSEVLIPVAATVAGAIAKVASAIAGLTENIMGAVRAHEAWKASTRESGADMANAIENDLIKQGRGTVDGNGFGIFDPRGQDVYDGTVNPFALPGSTQSPTSLLRAPDTDERREAALAAIQSQIEAERAVIEEGRERELSGARGHAAALEEIQMQSNRNRLNDYGTFFGNMATIAQAGGEKTFKVMKAFSAAQALVNSYAAYTEVLKDPALVGQPWLRQAMAVSTLGAGLAQVANIRSATIGGASGGAGAAGAAATAQPTVSRNIAIELQGDVFTRKSIIGLIGQFNEAIEDGAVLRVV